MRAAVPAVLVSAAAVGAALLSLALIASTPAPRTAGEPFRMPQDLAYRYVATCLGELDTIGPAQIEWGDRPAVVSVAEDPTPEAQAALERTEDCLNRYRYEPRDASFNFVSAYERAQLFDWYTRDTAPCLEAQGIDAPEIPRAEFFVPDQRPWNVYTQMSTVPFTRLIELYQACPPVPQYLTSRHAP